MAKKDVEGKDLQRHWINLQTELVAKHNDNSELSESHARLTSNFSILYQKKVGLEQTLEQEQKQVRVAGRAIKRWPWISQGPFNGHV